MSTPSSKPKQKRRDRVTLSIGPAHFALLKKVAAKERRSMAETLRIMIEERAAQAQVDCSILDKETKT